MTNSLLTAGMKCTFSPSARNRPSYRAMKKPAESMTGTTATFRFCCSTGDAAAVEPALEHPAANTSAAAATSSVGPRERLDIIFRPFLAHTPPRGRLARLAGEVRIASPAGQLAVSHRNPSTAGGDIVTPS